MRRTLLLALLPLAACVSAPAPGETPQADPTPVAHARVAAPVEGIGASLESAYAAAALVRLPEVPPEDDEDLHHVYHLSEQIISGAEPKNRHSLEALRDMGVRTVLSVDGKAPAADEAEELGLRYVHVPIQYAGLTEDELLKIAKTFRELEGPFYVHCYHGKHRGPAAAAVGRLVLDGVSREQALAEMRQWMGTSSAYEGLYATIACGDIPEGDATQAFAWGFDRTQDLGGVAGGMVLAARSYDGILDLSKNGWQVAPSHPDLTPEKELPRLRQILERSLEAEEPIVAEGAYREHLDASLEAVDALIGEVTKLRSGQVQDPAAADEALRALKASCTACHVQYRN